MPDTNLSRTPLTRVKRILRKEVNYGCPAPNCGKPFFTWHHFDPPWKIEKHYNPDGMIALCANHHGLAAGGEYSREQLREWKQNRANLELLKKKYEWMFPWCLIRLGECRTRVWHFGIFSDKARISRRSERSIVQLTLRGYFW